MRGFRPTFLPVSVVAIALTAVKVFALSDSDIFPSGDDGRARKIVHAVRTPVPTPEAHPAYTENERTDAPFEGYLVGDPSGSDSRAFFDEDSARTVFGTEVKLTSQPKVHLLNARLRPLPEDDFVQSPELAGGDGETRGSLQEPDISGLSLTEQLRVRFGDPGAEPEMIPEVNSPRSFKGLIAALEAGDDKLAFKYARQFVRYQRNYQERVKKVVEMSQLAMEQEGLKPPAERSEDPEYEATRKIAEEDSETRLAGIGKRISITDKAREVIEAAELDEDKEILPAVVDEEVRKIRLQPTPRPFDETEARAEVRTKVRSLVPIDPKKKVVLYYFFRPSDARAVVMHSQIEPLVAAYKNDPDVRIVGFTIDRNDSTQIEGIVQQQGIQFPLRSGADFAERLGVKSSPSIVVLAPTTGEAYVDEGPKALYYMDELIKLVKGESRG